MNVAAYGRPQFAIVEDEPYMAQLVSDMLLSGGADVEIFQLGSDLLKSVNLLNFRLIILDLSLPDIDGFDLMDKLASKYIGMSLVLASGHDQAVVRAATIYGNGLGLKICAGLTKPFSRDELFAAVGLPS
jgi:two-component system OmpR family response regulator